MTGLTGVALQAVALRGPGLDGWAAARDCMAGRRAWVPSRPQLPPVELLAANERRRLTPTLRLALGLATEACADLSDAQRAELPGVFASALGDCEITDRICRALGEPGRPLSPTQFHNSVHNAAAGYWAIATGNRCASNSLAAGEWSAGAALLEAYSQCQAERRPVLLVLYDVCPPPLLRPLAGVTDTFGMALRLAPLGHPGPALARYRLTLTERAETRLPQPWEALRQIGPAARHLALPYAVANGLSEVVLPLDRWRTLQLQREDEDGA